MLSLIEALKFRCLRYARQSLAPFHVLVGPNASGKTTFLDVVAFLGQLVSDGPEEAFRARTNNFEDLVWNKLPTSFELAVEARIPEDRHALLGQESSKFHLVRYEVCCGADKQTSEVGILAENVHLRTSKDERPRQLEMFPGSPPDQETIMTGKGVRGVRRVITKVKGGNDNFYSELHKAKSKSWFPSIKLGPRKSALANVPADGGEFPVAAWLRELLTDGVKSILLDSRQLRVASPPGKSRWFRPDGSNLPWVIADLQRRAPGRFSEWISHLQTALPDLETVRTVERQDDRHRYLILRYRGGLEVPSWVASDGTLRLLALTLLAYLPELRGVYLIEEPENGIHPSAVEAVYQSLSAVYDAQVLVATHSPVILSLARPEDVLCFAKAGDGATDTVRGTEHPALRNWSGVPNLSVLFGSGLLG